MRQFIIPTKDEAAKLRGITSPGHALDPIELEDGVTFILPLEILDDPVHIKFIGDCKADPILPVNVKDPGKHRNIPPTDFKKEPTNGDKESDPKDFVNSANNGTIVNGSIVVL